MFCCTLCFLIGVIVLFLPQRLSVFLLLLTSLLKILAGVYDPLFFSNYLYCACSPEQEKFKVKLSFGGRSLEFSILAIQKMCICLILDPEKVVYLFLFY